jgi:putative SOS response-associated peptidase YedK
MCGRYTVTDPAACLAEWSLIERHPVLEPRYNVAPSDPVPIVRLVAPDTSPQVDLLRWGLIPWWGEKLRARAAVPTGFIMARAESVASKSPFAAAFRERRCLFVADGFYEWRTFGKRRLPYYVQRQAGRPFTIAGIWEPGKEGGPDTCALITRSALFPIDALHDRMPAVIEKADRAAWLDPKESDVEKLRGLLTRATPDFACFPVSPRVNATANDDPSCVVPVPEAPLPAEQLDLWPAERPPKARS